MSHTLLKFCEMTIVQDGRPLWKPRMASFEKIMSLMAHKRVVLVVLRQNANLNGYFV